MNTKGFDFLKTRNRTDVIDFGANVKFPPLYKLFCKTFELGPNALKIEGYLDDNQSLIEGGYIEFGNDADYDILQEFLTLDEINSCWDGIRHEEEWKSYGLIRIAYLGLSSPGGLYVCCSEDKEDQVWLYSPDEAPDSQYLKIADNVFDFVKMLRFNFDESLNNKETFSKVFKKWGDEHWTLPD